MRTCTHICTYVRIILSHFMPHTFALSLPTSLTPFLFTHILIILLPLPSHPSPHARIRATSSPPPRTIVVLTHTTFTHPHTYSPTSLTHTYVHSLSYLRCQVFASALNLFQELELWDEVVSCYQLLQVVNDVLNCSH